MPIDAIKIDASFIHAMTADDKNRRIVEAIVMLGRNLGAEVVAEGVETAAQAAALQRLGCALVQGFLYSEPLDFADAAALLAAEAATTTGPILAASLPGNVGTA
jgi:EAL domain-containing protein (putative c-di-GMP-specific phosphodiesterase class I)